MANDNIFQQYLAPPKSVLDFQADYDAADQRKQTLAQNAIALAAGQQKFDEAQQASQRSALLRSALAGLPQGATDDQRIQTMRATGTPEGFAAADALDKSLVERRKGGAAANKDDADAAKTNYALRVQKSDQAIKDIAGFQGPQEALASLQAHVAAGDVSPDHAELIRQGMPQDPAKFADWKVGMIRNIMSAKEQMQYLAPNANTVATNARTEAEGKANRENAVKLEKMRGDRQDAGDAANANFTPEAIDNAAKRYNFDGTLPPMGMGKTGAAGRTAILNRAAELAAGVDGTDQRSNQYGNKADAAARAASVRAYSASGKEGQAIQSTNTGLNHLETIEQLAAAQKNGNTPLFNSIANRLAAETGQPAPTSLAAAITMVAPEVSKAVIGAAGGQEERAQFAKNFNPNGSPQQTLQGIGVIKDLMGGRLTEAQRTYERTTGKKDFRDTMLSPAAQRVLDKAHGAAGGSAKPSLTDIFGH